jgi:6-phosphofructokinase 1
MVHGLSHIVYIASSEELYQRTVEFYRAFGFKVLTAPNQVDTEEEGKETWLKMQANEHVMTSDVTIRLVLNNACVPKERPQEDQDWSLNESALALSIFDVGVSNIYLCCSVGYSFSFYIV